MELLSLVRLWIVVVVGCFVKFLIVFGVGFEFVCIFLVKIVEGDLDY